MEAYYGTTSECTIALKALETNKAMAKTLAVDVVLKLIRYHEALFPIYIDLKRTFW